MRGLVFGWGVNDSPDPVYRCERNRYVWQDPCYAKWVEVIRRGHSTLFKSNSINYLRCTVDEEWKYFTKFREWMLTKNYFGRDIDKDLLTFNPEGVYSPNTCLFIPSELNVFLTLRGAKRGEFPIGVYKDKRGGRPRAQISSGLRSGIKQLGSFDTVGEAHSAWKRQKLIYLQRFIEEYSEEPDVLVGLRRIEKILLDSLREESIIENWF